MKTPSPLSLIPSSFFLLLSFFLYPSSLSFAGMPQPMAIYYGQAKDGYGWPYRENAEVMLLSGTNTVAQYTIDGSLRPGVNFALRTAIDDGRSTLPYVQHAIKIGEPLTIQIKDRYGLQTIMESNAVPATSRSGQMIMINVTAGEDRDGDSMSDQWENELIYWANDPAYQTVEDIKPGDDLDGDGQSNRNEYKAGTFAFLDYDYFFAEQVKKTASGQMEIKFLSVAGKTYQLYCTDDLMTGTWSTCPCALIEDGPIQNEAQEGDGSWRSFYVPFGAGHQLLRLQVK